MLYSSAKIYKKKFMYFFLKISLCSQAQQPEQHTNTSARASRSGRRMSLSVFSRSLDFDAVSFCQLRGDNEVVYTMEVCMRPSSGCICILFSVLTEESDWQESSWWKGKDSMKEGWRGE